MSKLNPELLDYDHRFQLPNYMVACTFCFECTFDTMMECSECAMLICKECLNTMTGAKRICGQCKTKTMVPRNKAMLAIIGELEVQC